MSQYSHSIDMSLKLQKLLKCGNTTNHFCITLVIHNFSSSCHTPIFTLLLDVDDYVLDKSIIYLFSNVSSFTRHSSKCFALVKSYFFTSISKSFVTYITSTVTNISNNIMKQNYGIRKTFKVKVIVKKKNLTEILFLFRTGLSLLISMLSSIARIYL